MAVSPDCSRERAAAPQRRRSPLLAGAAAIALAAAVMPAAARAATPAPSQAEVRINAPNDPWEWLNRRFYSLHRVLDRVILRPAAIAYQTITPRPIRAGLHNFVANLDEPLVFANDILQLHFHKGARTAVRFAANSTFGLGGLVDIASKTGLPHHDNDFGTTLASYGVPAGPYVFLPLLGPSTIRDLVGSGIDFAADPLTVGHYRALAAFNTTTFVVGGLDQRANAESDLQEIDQMGTDSYATLRSLYLQSREALIDQRPVDIQNLPQFDDPGAAVPPPAAGGLAQAAEPPASSPSAAPGDAAPPAPAAADQLALQSEAPEPPPAASDLAAVHP